MDPMKKVGILRTPSSNFRQIEAFLTENYEIILNIYFLQ